MKTLKRMAGTAAIAVLLSGAAQATTINFSGDSVGLLWMGGGFPYPPYASFSDSSSNPFTASWTFDENAFICSSSGCTYSGVSSLSMLLDGQYHASSANHYKTTFGIKNWDDGSTSFSINFFIKSNQSDWEIVEGNEFSGIYLSGTLPTVAAGGKPDFLGGRDYMAVLDVSYSSYIYHECDGPCGWIEEQFHQYSLYAGVSTVSEVPVPAGAPLFASALLYLAGRKISLRK